MKAKKGRVRIIGKVVYHNNFQSKYLKNERTVFVWLPPSYEDNSGKNYPVLYMHDGQNLINPKTSFAGVDWRVDETATKLIKEKKIEEIIIVGIYNSKDRLLEYNDSKTGQNYMKFIINELKPFIDKNYRTLSDKNNSAVMGSSMGGLISFLITWYFPNVFSQAACLSTSFFYEDEKIINMVKNYNDKKKRINIYIDSGEDGLKEGQKMFCALSEKGFVIGKDLDYFYVPGAQHNEEAWANRLERPLIFFFGSKPTN